MKRLLVIFHIYYHDQIDYFIDKLTNINNCDWDLMVTWSQRNEATESKLKEFRKDVRFMEVENVGYDVWPFIKAIRTIDISEYEYILKVHTKNVDTGNIHKLNGLRLQGESWRNTLVDSLLKSRSHFTKCLDAFEDPKTGLVCSYEMYTSLSHKRAEDRHLLDSEEARIGITEPGHHFCAGTMFIVRSRCLEKIRKARLDAGMWGLAKSHSKGSLAHVYERIFGTAVKDSGYIIKRIPTYTISSSRVYTHKHISPLFKFLVNVDYYLINGERRKHLVLLGQKFPL